MGTPGMWSFMGDHPWLTFFLAMIVAGIIKTPFRLVNRWIRHKNIEAKGWPPFHLDADGDARSLDEDDVQAMKAQSSTGPRA